MVNLQRLVRLCSCGDIELKMTKKGKQTLNFQRQKSEDYITISQCLLFLPFLLQVIKGIFKTLSYAFLIFPQFNFGNGLMQLARMNIEVQILSGYGIDAYQNPFSKDALGWMFISSLIQGLVFFTLRLLLNRFLTRKLR